MHRKIIVRQLQTRLSGVRQWRISVHEARLDDKSLSIAVEVVGNAMATYCVLAIRTAGRKLRFMGLEKMKFAVCGTANDLTSSTTRGECVLPTCDVE